MEKMCKVEISARYVRELENELEAKISEIDALRVQLDECLAVAQFEVTYDEHRAEKYRAEEYRAEEYRAAWQIERQKNAKLRKKLAKLKHQRKSVLNTLDEMFKIRGE